MTRKVLEPKLLEFSAVEQRRASQRTKQVWSDEEWEAIKKSWRKTERELRAEGRPVRYPDDKTSRKRRHRRLMRIP